MSGRPANQVMHSEQAADFPREPGMLVRSARRLAAVVLRWWLRYYHRFVIVGKENLPLDRSFVLVANHASHLDTLCLLAALPYDRLHATFPVAAKDYFCQNVWRSLLASVLVNALLFERRSVAWSSLAVCIRLLERPGSVLVVFPEGTRCNGLEPGDFKPGIALLAAGREVPVVPCRLDGTRAALPKGAWLPRPRRLRLTIGTPRIYAHLPATKESRRQICKELRQAVRCLGQPWSKKPIDRRTVSKATRSLVMLPVQTKAL